MGEREGHSGIKAGLWYTIGNMLIKGIPFLTLPIFTRLLTTAEFGIYNTFISYEGILSILLGMGISGTVKVAKFDFREKFDSYISSAYSLVLTLGVVVLFFANVYGFVHGYNGWLNSYIVNLLIIHSIAIAIYGIAGCKYVIEGKYVQNLLIAFGMTGLNIAVSLIFCFIGMSEQRDVARITGTTISSFFISLIILAQQGSCSRLMPYKEGNRYALKLGIPLIPHQLSISLLAQCDKIMIQGMVGSSEAGIYGLAVNFTMVLSVLMTSVDNAWTPWFYSCLDKKQYHEACKVNNRLVVFFMYLTCGFLLVGSDVIKILSVREYWDSIYAFIPLTISIYLNFMYLFSVGIEYFKKKTGYISTTTILCTVANIVLNIVFIRVGGYLAAAYATCISKALLFVLHYIRSKKILKERVVDLKYLLLSLTAVCVVAVYAGVFVNMILLRYLMVVVLTIEVGVYYYRIGYLDNVITRLKKR